MTTICEAIIYLRIQFSGYAQRDVQNPNFQLCPAAHPVNMIGTKMAARRQPHHITAMLCHDNPQITFENRILENIKETARRGIKLGARGAALQSPLTLYVRYRRGGLPLRNHANRKLPPWRSLSQWMKTQLAALCLGELSHSQIRVNLHDQLRKELEDQGSDAKVYLRDRFTRLMSNAFSPPPMFLFVLEDLDADGQTAKRIHAHGIIELPYIDLSAIKNSNTRARFDRLIVRDGDVAAQRVAAHEAMKPILKQAAGKLGRSAIWAGVDQKANVWMKKSYNPLFNSDAISYAFKNVDSAMSKLPLNRLAVSASLKVEAQRFWELIRVGEPAMQQWS